MSSESHPAYLAAVQQASYFQQPDGGLIQVAGPDRVAFVQRQTTNDAQRLELGHLQLSVLTNPAARILDVFHILPGSDELLLITLPGLGSSTAAYLKRRIFFMDKVSVTDVSASYLQIELVGPQVNKNLKRLGVQTLPTDMDAASVSIGGVETRLLATSRATTFGCRLLVAFDSGQTVLSALETAGFTSLDTDTFELLRIESGLPAANHELSEEYTPLEAGLQKAISATKGCYTGQEVIARQITYDKVTQQLCGIRFSQTATSQRLWAEGKLAGTVTSTTNSPRFGPIGLAIIKRPYNQPGIVLVAGDTFEVGQTAEVIALPFV